MNHRIFVLHTGLAILLLGLPMSLQAAQYFHPKWSPDGRSLACYAYVDGAPDLYLLKLDTGALIQVTDTPDNWEIEPRWLDDDTVVAASGQDMRHIRLHTVEIATGEQKQLTGHKELEIFAGTVADGEHLLVSWRRDGQFNIFETTFDGQVVRQITHGISNEVATRVTHSQEILVNRDGEISLLPLAGGPETHLFKAEGNAVFPDISPDGKRVVYVGEENGITDLFVYQVADGVVTRLTNDADTEYAPSWSPDGKKIAYAVTDGDEDVNILTLILETGQIRNWTKDAH